jgi:hypothetical protein
MDLFECSAEDLAKQFAENKELYSKLTFSLDYLKDKLNKKINLESTIEKIEKANKLVNEGKYFLFSVYDSWGERVYNNGYGFGLFQLINGEMIELTSSAQGPPSSRDIISYLKENKINKIYNPAKEIVGDYKGAEGYDQDDDGDCFKMSSLKFSPEILEFKKKGIEIIGLEYLSR